MLRYHIAAVLFLVATAASAQQPFGVVISGSSEATCELAAGAPHAVQWINPDRTVDFSDILVVASAPGQPVFALLAGSAGGFSGGEIVRIEPDGSRTPFVPASTGFAADNLAVAHTGRVFTTIGAGLAVFSPAGIHEGTYPMPDRIGKIAVAPDDGCTVYYEKTGSVIGRMNGCTGAILPDFTQVLPFVRGLSLMWWATATWWIPMLLILGLWRHVYRKFPLRYDPLYWGAVFPLGMYTVCTLRLSQAIDAPYLAAISSVFVYAALLAWSLAIAGMLHHLFRAAQSPRSA